MNMFKLHRLFTPEVFLAVIGLGFSSSKSQQSTSSATTNQVTDNRVAASEGSISAGSGASVSVQTTDPQAFDAIASIANEASASLTEGFSNAAKAVQNTAAHALDANTDVSTTAIGAGVAQTRDVLDFGERALTIATNAANQSQAQTNDLIQRTNEQFTAKLASNAGDAPQQVAQDAIKYGAVALVVLVGALFLLRPSPKAA
jgi:2-keto-3-deoxy-galactonokinase